MSVGDVVNHDLDMDDDGFGVDFDAPASANDAPSSGSPNASPSPEPADRGSRLPPTFSQPDDLGNPSSPASSQSRPTQPVQPTPPLRQQPTPANDPALQQPAPGQHPSAGQQDFGQLTNEAVQIALSFGMAPEHVAAYRDNPAALEAAISQVNEYMLRSSFPQQQFPQQPVYPQPHPAMGMQYPPQQYWQPNPVMGQQPMAFPAPGMMGPQQQQPLNNPASQQFQLWRDQAERDQFDPEFAGKLESMHSFYEQQMSALNQQLQQVAGFTQQQVAEQQFRQRMQQAAEEHTAFDRLIESLGGDYEVLFGKGGHTTLDRGSLYFNNRRQLYDAYHSLRQQYASRGLHPDQRTLLSSAASLVLGPQWNHIDSQARQTRANQRGLSRPNRGASPPEQGDQAALRFINGFMAQRGMPTANEVPLEEDESIGLL